MDLDSSLDKVRIHKQSKIKTQRDQTLLLEALESELKESTSTPPPTAYFAALLSLLDRPDAQLSAISLLSYVVPFVPKPLLASKIDLVVGKILPVLLYQDVDTAVSRACIAVLESVLISIESSSWNVSLEDLGAPRVFTGVLGLAQDPRPKIRKRALEAVSNILEHGQLNRQACVLAFEAAVTNCENNSDFKSAQHGLQLLKVIAKFMPLTMSSTQLERLINVLLQVSRSSDHQIVLSALQVFHNLFQSKFQTSLTGVIVKILLDSLPSVTDKQLTPAWLAALSESFGDDLPADLVPLVFKTVAVYLESPPAPQEVVESAGQCLIALMSECISNLNVDTLNLISREILLPLLAVKFRSSWNVVCEVCSAFLAVLSREAALQNEGIQNIVRVIGCLRGTNPELDNGADAVLSAALKVLGPELVCEELVPLSLDPKSSNGRAWLLPLMAENVENTNLSYYFHNLVPLGDLFLQEAENATNNNRKKILETVAFQIHYLFPQFCNQCLDLEVLDNQRLELVLTWLYSRPEMRPAVCHGLRMLTVNERGEDFGAKFGSDILRALLNVYQVMSNDNRGFVLEAVDAILSVLPLPEVTKLFGQLCGLIEQTLQETDKSYALLDIANIVVPYASKDLSVTPAILTLGSVVCKQDDPSMQKKGYRLISNIENAEEVATDLANLMLELQPIVAPNARRTRIVALTLTVNAIPISGDFSFVFRIMPEVILATKDMNERTRSAAFDLLIVCGQKMAEGKGVVNHENIPMLNDASAPQTSVMEYFEMIMAGLAGDTPHMIAATVTALSRVFYEYAELLPLEKVEEYVDIVWMLLDSPNKEIVASVLGFVKVSMLLVSEETLLARLEPLVKGLISWSNEHKNHFKNKVRHLVERLIRRCGYDAVAKVFPESDMKLLQHIQKSKEKSKRKKKAGVSGETDEAGTERVRKFDNEFDEALYGSSDDDDDDNGNASDDDDESARNGQQHHANGNRGRGGRGGRKNEQFILNSKDPLDLLDKDSLKHLSSAPKRPTYKRNTHEMPVGKDGRMLIRNAQEVKTAQLDENARKDALSSFMDALKSGPVRTQSGKLKYKRGRRAEKEDDDDLEDHDKSSLKPKVRGAVNKSGLKKHMKKRRNL